MKVWLRSIGADRFWLASQLGVSKRGVDAWLSSSRPIPQRAARLINQLMEQVEPMSGGKEDKQCLVLSVDSVLFDRWNAAATKEGKLIRQWATDVLDVSAGQGCSSDVM